MLTLSFIFLPVCLFVFTLSPPPMSLKMCLHMEPLLSFMASVKGLCINKELCWAYIQIAKCSRPPIYRELSINQAESKELRNISALLLIVAHYKFWKKKNRRQKKTAVDKASIDCRSKKGRDIQKMGREISFTCRYVFKCTCLFRCGLASPVCLLGVRMRAAAIGGI